MCKKYVNKQFCKKKQESYEEKTAGSMTSCLVHSAHCKAVCSDSPVCSDPQCVLMCATQHVPTVSLYFLHISNMLEFGYDAVCEAVGRGGDV